MHGGGKPEPYGRLVDLSGRPEYAADGTRPRSRCDLDTLYLNFEKEVEAALGLPADVHSYALLPIGYPMGRFGPVRRVPVAEIAYEDRWGQAYRDQ